MATAQATVSITQASFERLQQRAAEENRTLTDLVEEALREAEEREEILRRMDEAMERSQAEAIRNGTSTMTMDEIDNEIAEMHRERADLRKSA